MCLHPLSLDGCVCVYVLRVSTTVCIYDDCMYLCPVGLRRLCIVCLCHEDLDDCVYSACLLDLDG